ncbi:MAG: PhzF family phenazine biosynthesis protein [Xanthomonadaceae bacterium]|nr:PhzF family phenazine biosynthesis protein [Xanthomonadaceae bacterium]MDE2246365.1 PhzF family phenazine biosynthesis protein [Xanthomonadaceae bacterium]
MSRYLEIDVFTLRPFHGNPLAVIVEAGGLDAVAMQRIAAWTNLSETAFLLPPTTPAADYRVRIFTPRQELPFAGHPSVGAAYAAIIAGRMADGPGSRTQECAAGLLPLRIEGRGPERRIHVQAPRAKLHPPLPFAQGQSLARALGASLQGSAQVVDVGAVWLLAGLADAATVRALQPDPVAIAALTQRTGCVGVAVFGREPAGGVALAVRAFCPGDGIAEDPVTGSANAAIGALLHQRGELATIGARYRVSQGREVGRDGQIEVQVEDEGAVWIGGHCTACVEGVIAL